MAVFDDIENIIQIFQLHFNKIPKDEIISVLNATSFNIEQTNYDLSTGLKNNSFTNEII